MVARLDPRGLQRVGEAVRALVEVAVIDLAALVDQRDPIGHLVGGQLEQVGEVVMPLTSAIRPKVEHVPFLANARPGVCDV